MRRFRWVMLLYPPAWSQRYGAELQALIEDAGSNPGDLGDLIRSALTMRLTTWNSVTLAAVFTIAGALVAVIASLPAFSGYVATSTLSLNSSGPAARAAFTGAAQRTMSRSSLAEILTRPSLNLYLDERRRLPLEDVIFRMRSDISIQTIRGSSGQMRVQLAFRHSDPSVAASVNRALAARLRETLSAAAPVEVVQSSATIRPQLESKRPKMIAMGAAAGLGACLLVVVILRAIRGNQSHWRAIASFTAAGAAIALIGAALIPDEYVSTAVIHTSGPVDPAIISSTILSSDNLANVIRSQGLYPGDAGKVPPEKLAGRMRSRDLQIRSVNGSDIAYVISFRDTDRARAQAATSALVSTWIEKNLTSHFAGQSEVLDPASAPATPVFPNRGTIVSFGALAGLLLGAAASHWNRQRRPLL